MQQHCKYTFPTVAQNAVRSTTIFCHSAEEKYDKSKVTSGLQKTFFYRSILKESHKAALIGSGFKIVS